MLGILEESLDHLAPSNPLRQLQAESLEFPFAIEKGDRHGALAAMRRIDVLWGPALKEISSLKRGSANEERPCA